MSPKLITIDGPAGCGKSTVARALAQRLAGVAFNTGHIYRALTCLVLSEGISPEDTEAVLQLLEQDPIRLDLRGGELMVLLRGQEPGEVLRSAEVTRSIHWIADAPQVRDRLLPIQRQLPEGVVVVAEGRDLGSVVFPDAALKVFLTATAEERARRRHRELEQKQAQPVSYEEVLARVKKRDAHDTGREIAPLVVPDGALEIDTTELTSDAVVARVLEGVPREWLQVAED